MALADGAFFHPTDYEYDRPENHGLAYEDVWFPSSDGAELHGWFFPAEGAGAIGTVVHCHGNAGNVSGHFPMAAWLAAYGWNVLCFDYRGYGRSSGRISRSGAAADVEAAVAYVRGRPDIEGRKVCLYGHSIGAVLAIVAAGRGDLGVAGLCLDGPFAGYREEARFMTRRIWYLWAGSAFIARFLISDEWSARDYVGRLPAAPKLFVAGTADTIVDYRQVVALYEAASEPKDLWLVEGGEHCAAVMDEDPAGRERVARFLAGCVAGAGGAGDPAGEGAVR